MKILQVVPYFYPAWAYGGPGKLVFDTSRELTKRGHTIVVYTSDAFDATHRMPEEKRIHAFAVHYFRNLSNSLAFYSNIYLPIGLFFHVPFELFSFDVIHLHDFYTLANIWVILWAKIYRIPYIMSVHGCLESERRKEKSFFKNLFLRLFGISMLQGAARVIATSATEEKAYQSLSLEKEKIVRMGHGVDSEEFKTVLSKAQCRNKLSVRSNAIVFTYLGRIHRIKGLDLLVQAFGRIKNKNILLVIAGSDEGFLSVLKEHIKKGKLEDRVILLGTTTGETKARLFKATDIFVYPSYSEGFSLGILEAASVGLPLLLSTGCYFPEAEKYGAAMIFPPKASNLATKMREIAASTVIRKKMGKQAIYMIAEKYSLKKNIDAYLEVYIKAKTHEKN